MWKPKLFGRRKSLAKTVVVEEENLEEFLDTDSLAVVHALASWGGGSMATPKVVLHRRFIGEATGLEKTQMEKRLVNVLKSLAEKNCVSDDGDYVSWSGSWSCTNCVYCQNTCTKRGLASMIGGAKRCSQYHPKQIGGA